MRNHVIIGAAAALSLASCGNKSSSPSQESSAATNTASQAPVATPDDWHACDSLFAMAGGVNGKVVADLFVGDGYYTMKLLEAGARVIAMDDDPRNIEALAAKKSEMKIGDDRLIIRTCTPGTPALSQGEVDLALCTRPFISIPDRDAYFKKVKASVKAPSMLLIVDFLPEQTPVGTPMDQRISSEQVMDAMEAPGFTDIGAYTKKLPYRYVVQAMDYVEGTLPEGVLAQPQ